MLQYSFDILQSFFSSLENRNQKFSCKYLKKLFELHSEEDIHQLENDLRALEENGIILMKNNEYMAFPKNTDLIQTDIKISRQGFGYFYLDNSRYTIHPNDLEGALHNDLCLFVIDKEQKKAKVKKIIKRNKNTVVCEMKNGKLIIYGTISSYKIDLKNSNHQLVDGSRVLVQILNAIDNETLQGNIIELLGHKDDPDIDLKTIAISKCFDIEFSKDALAQLDSIPSEIEEEELKGRLDLRNHLIYTIDCDHTKDMDDAISVEINDKGNYIVGVHIADVAHYIKPNTPLFEEAYNRGTSVYMIDSVIPMIPKLLSNGICSLNPNVDRLTKSCIMELDPNGNLLDYKIVSSVICSKIKMSYSEVNQILEKGKFTSEYEPFIDNLKLLQKLNRTLELKKGARGYLNFCDNELDIQVDEKGIPQSFKIHEQKTAEKIIENLMLLANETIASHYSWCPFIFRVHDIPNAEVLKNILDFLRLIGYRIQNIKSFNNPKAIQGILKNLSKTEEFSIASNMILRGMKKAVYTTDNIGHFGLDLENYTHFTSPIRRLPDLLVHTLIDIYENPNFLEEDLTKLEEFLKEASHHASFKERQADEAEYEANMMKMAEYMEQHIGEYFNGKIINITSSGILVETTNHITGKVYFSDIKGDFYQFNPETFTLKGKRKRETLHIGDKVRLKVKDASKEFRTIDFEICEKLALSNEKQKALSIV